MAYGLLIYPAVDEALVGRIRRAHDPTVDIVMPHIPVVFPVPESLGRDLLIAHAHGVLDGARQFRIRFGGLVQSPDHWLLLTLDLGNDELVRLHRRLHTGLLAGYATDRYTPHLGLGHFLVEGAMYDWQHPRPQDFDAARYEVARREAEPLLNGPSQTVETLWMVTVPDEVLEWTEGRRAAPPEGLTIQDVHAFHLAP